ncbi:MAG: type VI secretion system tube protein Hcp [Alphaproteobacteria bacterium]|nr:MAG: type VI secretion system tube protein Hcp [Alphaproteobacteria bacterium]
MAFDAFLKIDGIKGESQDKAMKDAIEIKSFSFGAENNINFGSMTGGGGAGKATFKEFTVQKQTDTASCDLFTKLCTGKHFKEASIELRRSGGADDKSGGVFMTFKFSMVMVQDITWSGQDGDDVCEEEVVFQYGAIKINYKKQKPDGKMEDAGEAMWSRVLNEASDKVE